ncbi:serine hydrolase domain-containing protein [Nonomuraea sp. NPDC003201]
MVVLQLAAEGKIDLADTIDRWLPDVPDARSITVRDLLRHTSGLPEFYDALGLKTSADWQRRRLERVTGDGYAEQVTRRVLRPLRLHDTYYAADQARIRGSHLHGYMPRDLPGKPDADYSHLVDFTEQTINQSGPAGSMVSTVADLAAFYRALFTGRLLPAPLMREMTSVVPVAGNPMPWVTGFGLGVHRYDLGCGPVYGHIGGMRGYTDIVVSTPDGRRHRDHPQPQPHRRHPGRAQGDDHCHLLVTRHQRQCSGSPDLDVPTGGVVPGSVITGTTPPTAALRQAYRAPPDSKSLKPATTILRRSPRWTGRWRSVRGPPAHVRSALLESPVRSSGRCGLCRGRQR